MPTGPTIVQQDLDAIERMVPGTTRPAFDRRWKGYLVFPLIWLLSACSSLPTIVPDMSRHRAQTVRLEGAHGPLSPERSRAVLQRLQSQGGETSILDRHLALEGAIGGTPLVVGNKVTLLQDGPATFKAMFAAIAKASDHINMETYIIEDDEVGNRFADALLAKQAEGVQVNLIYDSVGAINAPQSFFDRLRDGGIAVLEFNPINPLTARKGWEVNRRDHRKLLIVDGQIAFVGGINISSVYSSGSLSKRPKKPPEGKLPWRDTHVELEGPVVADFQRLFLGTWDKQQGAPLAQRRYFPVLTARGKEVVRAIGSSPDEPFSLIYATLITAIRSAETAVHLTFAYFVPDKQLLAALTDAADRGVDVKIILPSTTDSGLVFHAGRSYYTQLLKGGVKLYERRDALLHAKTAVIDGVWSTVGSTNLDWRSFLHNDEVNAVMLGATFGGQMQTVFDRDLDASNRITLDQWRKRPLSLHIKEKAARMWEYWL